MDAKLLHYYNKDTDDEYLVIKFANDDEDWGEDGYELLNECELLNADITLPSSKVFTRH